MTEIVQKDDGKETVKTDCEISFNKLSGILLRKVFLRKLINAIILWSGILNAMNVYGQASAVSVSVIQSFSLHLYYICGRVNFFKNFQYSIIII